MKNYLNEALKLIGLLLFQVLIVSHFNLNFYIQPYIHLLFLLSLPLNITPLLLMIFAFISGGLLDMFSNSIGMHIFASVLLAFLRPYIINLVSSKAMLENLQKISLSQTGWAWYISYLLASSALYFSAYFLVEHFSLAQTSIILLKTLYSTLLSSLLMFLLVLIFSSQKNRRAI